MIGRSHPIWRLVLSMALPFLLVAPVHAQKSKARTDSLKHYGLAIAEADSTGDVEGAIDQRYALASMLKRPQAISLLEQAAAIADSAGLLSKEIELQAKLAEGYERIGRSRKADAARARVAVLVEKVNLQEAEAARTRVEEERDLAVARGDSMAEALCARLREMESNVEAERARADRWTWIAVATTVLLLIALVWAIVHFGLAQRRLRVEITTLSAALKQVQERPRNVVRQPEEEVAAPPEVATPLAVVQEPPDELLVSMFRKTAPERTRTLEDARARGDHEKVVRVVHSLKPQLVGLNPGLFAPLCARITSSDAGRGGGPWNDDLDALVRGIDGTLRELGH